MYKRAFGELEDHSFIYFLHYFLFYCKMYAGTAGYGRTYWKCWGHSWRRWKQTERTKIRKTTVQGMAYDIKIKIVSPECQNGNTHQKLNNYYEWWSLLWKFYFFKNILSLSIV